jgi:hypothetical protein
MKECKPFLFVCTFSLDRRHFIHVFELQDAGKSAQKIEIWVTASRDVISVIVEEGLQCDDMESGVSAAVGTLDPDVLDGALLEAMALPWDDFMKPLWHKFLDKNEALFTQKIIFLLCDITVHYW